MSRVRLRRQAISLRQKGKTYSEIRKELAVPKSTLSNWLNSYPLTAAQLILLKKKIEYKRQIAIEKTRLVKLKKREQRLKQAYHEQKLIWSSLTQRELEIAGIFLYWGEGSKYMKGSLSLNNTDPKVLKFTLYWLVKGLHVPEEKIKVFLHLYSDMNKEEEMLFWSDQLKIPLSQFSKPYIKESKRIEIDQKGFGHGTCGLSVNDIRLKERVMMAINAIADTYSEKI